MHTKLVGEIIKWYNIKYHCYADDTQVFMTLKPCDKWDDISSSIEACIADIIIIIMHVYIAPEPGNPVLRRCTVLLSLTQICFHPTHISTPKGAYNAYCHYRRKALLKHIAIVSCQVLIFMDE